MNYKHRVAFVVYVDLDPMPGTFHSKESAQNVLRNIIHQRISHYNPTISLAPASVQPEIVKDDAVHVDRLFFNNHVTARYVYDLVLSTISRDSYVTVAELYVFASLPGDPYKTAPFSRNGYWGWDNSNDIGLEQVSDEYVLVLPPPIRLSSVHNKLAKWLEPTNEGIKN